MSLLIPEIKRAANKHVALIDADVLRYRIGFASQKEKDSEGNPIPDPIEKCLHSCKVQIETILERLDTERYKLFLTGEGNFRFEVAKSHPYKGNRTLPKPYHYDNLTKYLIERWDAEVVNGIEADDALGIRCYSDYRSCGGDRQKHERVICSIDKDLDMIPGWHYNFVKDRLYFVTEEEGIRWFYTQMLTGDTIDNIKGVHGIGPKKAEKLLADCKNEYEMYQVCLKAYENDEERLIENGRLLWILREAGQVWQPPIQGETAQAD